MRMLIKTKLSEHRYKTPEGYLVCIDSPIARLGSQEYRIKDICPDSDDDSIININRKEEDVFSPETIASFENKPLVNEHPHEDVNPSNFKNYSVGFIRDVHKGEYENQPVILATLIFTDEEAISDIENHRKEELSCGYDCDIIDENGTLCQKNIRGNHVALCEAGRAGIAKILDSEITDKPDLETNSGKQDYYFQQLMAALSILKPRDWNRVGTKVNLNGNNITFTASPKGITIYNSKNGNNQLVTSENEIKSYIKQHYINDELIQFGSEEALQKNIKTEIESGKDPKQAVAIAYSVKRKNDVDTREESTKKLEEELQTYEEDTMKKYYITYEDLYHKTVYKDVEVKANSINEALQKVVNFGTNNIWIMNVKTDKKHYPKIVGKLSELQKQNFEDSCVEDETIEYQGFKIEKNADTNVYGDVVITFDGKKRYFANVNEAKEFINLHVNDSLIEDGSLANSPLKIGQVVKFKTTNGNIKTAKVEGFWYKGNIVKEDKFDTNRPNHDFDGIYVRGEDGIGYSLNRFQLFDSKITNKFINIIKVIKQLKK